MPKVFILVTTMILFGACSFSPGERYTSEEAAEEAGLEFAEKLMQQNTGDEVSISGDPDEEITVEINGQRFDVNTSESN
ncbi:hypothetical protein GF376_02560 [Candidatus Peregrinibacteria bacterium]|nr:hypothetical protein [Candidatus Peregrinibacteria bacterium]